MVVAAIGAVGGEGRLGNWWRSVWNRLLWDRWGLGNGGRHEYGEVHSRGTRGVSRCSVGRRG